ncbi:MAG TPA: YqgE/AlgH family protein [Bacteroidia bacterium]|nr:YqgE/AlgH family protein [Bacteroidia bacterium]
MPLNSVKPQKGSLLISEPTLKDSYFNRSVILLVEHNNEGTVGFMLNKQIDIDLKGLIKDFDFVDTQVFFGGPVNKDNLFFVHTIGKEIEGAMPIAGNLFWGGDFTMLKDAIQKDSSRLKQIRFFIGYSGWDPGQLDMELEQNSWVVKSKVDENILNIQPKTLWKDILRNMGNNVALLSFFPENPQLN